MTMTTAVYSHLNLRASVRVHLENRHPESDRRKSLPSPEMLHWKWAGCFSETRTSCMGARSIGAETRVTLTTSGIGENTKVINSRIV